MTERIRVLVVDEDPDVRDLTKTFLEREDDRMAVETADSGAAAVERLDCDSFDAVVSDYRMPGMNGLELAAALEDDGIDVPFVLFSAADDPVTQDAVDGANVDAFVLKGSGTGHFSEITDAIQAELAR